MDFKLVLEKIITRFKKEKIHYALIGGFALGLWGINRSTVDIDFLVLKDDIGMVHKIMEGLGYSCVYSTENVSQFISPLSVFGEVDFLHAFREASIGMLKRAEERTIYKDTLVIKVLRPEDLIGLKAQALANNRSRWNADLADIEGIIAMNKEVLDWSMIEEYFALFGFEDLAKELREKYYGS